MTARRALTTRPARALVAGAGLMGSWHARAIERAGARVAVVVDPDRSRAATLAAGHRGAVAAASLDEVRAGTFDSVHVCSPVGTHEPLIRWAAGSGAHVLCEKPLAGTAAATRALLAEMGAAGLLLCPAHQVLFQRGVKSALARAARLRPVHVDLTICSAGAQGSDASAHDDLIVEILPNPVALVHRWLAPGSAGTWRVARHAPGEWLAVLDGSRPGVSILLSSHGRPPVNTARVIGEGGTAHLDLFHGFATFEPARVSKMWKVVRPLRLGADIARDAGVNLARRALLAQPAYPGLWELVREFYACLATPSMPPPISPEETIAVADACDAIASAADITPSGR